jgi:uncharacterized protein YdhG (YjbR/CyaY superfamily)
MTGTAKAPRTADEYVATVPKIVQAILRKVRAAFRRAAPGAQEALKYRLPTLVLGGNLAHLDGFAPHIGSDPTPDGIRKFQRKSRPISVPRALCSFPSTSRSPTT